MARFQRVQGDINDTLVIQLDGVADFQLATATANVWLPGFEPAPLTCTLANGVDGSTPVGLCTVHLGGPGEWLTTAEPGDYLIEVEVTFDDGSVLTWPEGPPDHLRVRADA